VLGPFRNQEPVNLLSLIIYLVVLKLPFFFVEPSPGSAIHYYDLSVFSSVLLAMLAILVQAFWWNILFARLGFYRGRTLVPAAIYIACSSVFPEFNRLNELHLIMFVFLFVLNQFLSIRTQEPGRVKAFYAGLALGILGVVLHPAVTMMLFGLVCLIVKQPSSWREYVMYLMGILTPFYFYGATEFILYNRPLSYLLPTGLGLLHLDISNKDIFLLVFSGVFLLAGLAGFIQLLFSLHLLKQKLAYTVLVFCLGIFATILAGAQYGLGIFYLAVLPMAIFLSVLKLRIPNPAISDAIHLIFVGTIFCLQFIHF
jgi:hypothetical protein